jgi:hypothetical protein
MTSIDEAARLAALIRAQMAGAAQQRTATSRSGNKEATERAATDAAGKDGPYGIPATVLAQVRSLSPDNAAPRKAFRLFLRATLAKQLAQASEGDTSFDHLVDQVMDMMTADQQLSDAIQKAGQQLVELAAHP